MKARAWRTAKPSILVMCSTLALAFGVGCSNGDDAERVDELEARVAQLEQRTPTAGPQPVPSPTPTFGEAAFTEYRTVFNAVSAMMFDNDIRRLPKPSAFPSGSGEAGCDAGTSDMGSFPDSSSPGSDKVTDADGNRYTDGVDPLGDKDGYVLFGHDNSGNNKQQEGLVNYITVQTTQFCYQAASDGGVIQFARDGTRIYPVPLPGQRVTQQPTTHIGLNEQHPPYSSIPATSGWHYGQPLAPVRWGVYGEFVPDEYLVHNLEHGGIGIHYDCPVGCPQLEEQLTEIVEAAVGSGLKVVLSPYPEMDTIISLTAWTFVERLHVFDQERILNFIKAHESSPNAPEPGAR